LSKPKQFNLLTHSGQLLIWYINESFGLGIWNLVQNDQIAQAFQNVRCKSARIKTSFDDPVNNRKEQCSI
jgi:hypothetical protein